MIIDIFGSPWIINENVDDPDLFDEDCAGFCDYSSKTIHTRRFKDDELKCVGDVMALRKYILRHKLIHAALLECGLGDNWTREPMGHDETAIDWLAHKAPQLHEIFEKANAL